MFIGSEKDTWNMDPELLEQAILPQCEKISIDFAVMEPIAA